MNAFRCMTDRTFAILSKTIGDKARTEKAYKWFDNLPAETAREAGKTGVVAHIMANRDKWDRSAK